MPELKGSKTEKNLWTAFAGESQARNKYTAFAKVAKKEGMEQIAAFFQQTADNELEHALLHLAALSGVGDTAANLKAAAEGEHEEWTSMYPTMAAEAKAEGFDALARVFEGLAKIEAQHEARYKALLANLEGGKVFQREGKVKWHCRNCGFVMEGSKAPEKCPVCSHPKAYFELEQTNY